MRDKYILSFTWRISTSCGIYVLSNDGNATSFFMFLDKIQQEKS